MLPNIVNNVGITWTQSFYTSLFCHISLMIFPYLAGITFVQIFIYVIVACISYSVLTTPTRVAEPQGNYVMTSIFTSLSVVLKENYEDIITNQDLKEEYETINSITPVDLVIQTTVDINLPYMYWAMEPVEQEQLSQWMRVAIKICVYY